MLCRRVSPVCQYLKGWEISRPNRQSQLQLLMSRSIYLSFASRDAAKEDIKVESVEDFLEPEKPKPLTDEQLLTMRNKSRLKPPHWRQINGEMPELQPDNPLLWFQNTVKFRRKLYAKFGEASGVNPGIQWPTHEQLKKRLEYESVAYPFTVQELMDNAKEKRRLQQEYIDNRTKEIETKTAAIEKLIEEVHNKKHVKEKEVLKSQERKEKMMEEVRRHFGYTMDPRDERFQALLEKKEKEEKKRTKEAKKLEREKRLLEGLQKKSSATIEASKSKQAKPKPAEAEDDD